MENLFTPSVTEIIIHRIGQLTNANKPLWGKMNVSQMLAHCQVPIQVGLGEARLKQTFIGFLFGKIAKKALLKDTPFKKNLPTDKSFIMAGEKVFEEEKNKLIDLIKRFVNAGVVTGANHPFFGKMNTEEWGLLTWKHLDHHLQQFGV